jgi:hypothetical protein
MQILLPRYPKPCKVLTNPRWCPYAKGSPHEGQAPRSSNSVESRAFSTCKWCSASDSSRTLPVVSNIEIPAKKRRVPRSLRYTVVVVTQTQLSRSRKTLAPLGTITTAHARAKGLCGFSKLTQLTRIHLEQTHKRSN